MSRSGKKLRRDQSREIAAQDESEDEEDDWYFELQAQPPVRQVQERQAAAGEQPPQERQIPRERWEVAHGPWRPKVNSPSPRERKRRKQQARNRDKGQRDHHYGLRSRG